MRPSYSKINSATQIYPDFIKHLESKSLDEKSRVNLSMNDFIDV